MRELPIIFNTPMVQAILEGRKTMTRRPIKNRLFGLEDYERQYPYNLTFPDKYGDSIKAEKLAPYQVGDRLYVRETWAEYGHYNNIPDSCSQVDSVNCGCCEGVNNENKCLNYKMHWYPYYDLIERPILYYDCFAKGLNVKSLNSAYKYRIRPSIHMPKKYARIWLEVTNVRVERVQDIDDNQAGKEGMSCVSYEGKYCDSGKLIFKTLWDKIYKTWDENPWVWVYEFKVIDND